MNLGTENKKGAGSGMQIYMLFALWFLGIILGASVTNLLLGEASFATASNIRISNSIGSVFMFLIPVSVYTWLFMGKNTGFLAENSVPLKALLLGALAILAVQPFVETISYYNEMIVLPESLSGVQEFFDKSKESSAKTFTLLFSDKAISSLFANLLVMAILPAVVEELFFRGSLQRSLQNASKNIHVAVWVAAVLFSLMHFQLSGLFARVILGALLGYLYYWSKNIWIPILVHAVNNSAVIIIAQLFKDSSWYQRIILEDYSISNAGLWAVISLLVTAVLLFGAYKLSHPKHNVNQ